MPAKVLGKNLAVSARMTAWRSLALAAVETMDMNSFDQAVYSRECGRAGTATRLAARGNITKTELRELQNARSAICD